MEVIRIVQKPVYVQRPFGGLTSPYTNHPECSVLCQHSKASAHHKSLIRLQKTSWVRFYLRYTDALLKKNFYNFPKMEIT